MSVVNPPSSQGSGPAASSNAPAPAPASAPGDDKPVTPEGDAGLFDVDPDQDGVSQSPDSITTGDVDAFPLDVEP